VIGDAEEDKNSNRMQTNRRDANGWEHYSEDGTWAVVVGMGSGWKCIGWNGVRLGSKYFSVSS